MCLYVARWNFAENIAINETNAERAAKYCTKIPATNDSPMIISQTETTQRNLTPYFGQIDTNLLIAWLLLSTSWSKLVKKRVRPNPIRKKRGAKRLKNKSSGKGFNIRVF